MTTALRRLLQGAAIASLACGGGSALASSHMDAPSITLDNPANTTDVYAFRSQSESGSTQYLSAALAVYPFEEPGIGPNNFRFDDDVLYEIHVSLGADVARGKRTLSYQFEFDTAFRNRNTILQSYLGTIQQVFDDNQNMRQTYKVTKVDHRTGHRAALGSGRVPPNNQGRVTFKYNQDDDGDNPAKEGVATEAALDDYTKGAIADLARGYRGFAGQRDDGFYADIQSIFDLDFGFGGPNKPFDSQGGFNVHTIVLDIPVAELGGRHLGGKPVDRQIVGVHATTSRREASRRSRDDDDDGWRRSRFLQVGRQGNPLFAEALIANRDKDLYNRTRPTEDNEEFRKYAENPELASVLGSTPIILGLIESIFIPDLIKVDLSTGPAKLAGNPDETGFHRLSVFGGDVLRSAIQDPFGNGGFIPGGWPNGRRFGDDVIDIALIALGAAPAGPATDVDRVTKNDITYNRVFPYAATPLNGRSHRHHGQTD